MNAVIIGHIIAQTLLALLFAMIPIVIGRKAKRQIIPYGIGGWFAAAILAVGAMDAPIAAWGTSAVLVTAALLWSYSRRKRQISFPT